MTSNTEAFDRWIRNDFKRMNTELEELYFAARDRNEVHGIGDDIKARLLEEGRSHISALLAEGNAARDALRDVSRFNDELFERLDTDRFFYCERAAAAGAAQVTAQAG